MTVAMYGLYLNGRPQSPHEREVIQSLNPSNNQAWYTIVKATSEDIDLAIRSSKRAFIAWSQTPAEERGQILRKAAALLRENNDELARLEALDTGKPIQETTVVDVCSAADCLEYYANLAANVHGQHISQSQSFIYTRREPLGVCVGIGAWNYPLQIACWKAAPALACGNSMVFKPSEFTSLTTLKLAELLTQAGLPDGVFNVITGDGSTGELLTAHPEIAKVSFTGSVASGKKVMSSAAQNVTPVTLELGGKSPLIIFADANLDDAVSAAMLANFYSQGEICSNGTRVFVESSIHDEFVSRLCARVEKMVIGDPMCVDTHMGPLISKQHLNKVMSYIDSGISEGAHLQMGGELLSDVNLAQGNYIRPTVFTQCQDDMSIVKEEIFGPVMSVLSFEREVEVIQRANNTPFGLAAGVFTQDISRAHRVVAQLQAGTCWINNYNITPIAMPFGAYKQSGLGRENGIAALEHYTQLKSVYVELDKVDCPYP